MRGGARQAPGAGGSPQSRAGLRGPGGRTIYQVPLGVIRRTGTSRGKVSDGAASAGGHPSVACAGAKRRAGLAAGSSAAAPGLSSRWLYLRAPAPGIRRFPCGGATARCPKPGAAPPAEVAANGEQGPGRLPPVRPRAPRTAPSGGARDRGCPAQCPCPSGPRPIPPARREGARRLAFSSASGRWETKHRDSLANDRRVVERGRLERRTPSLNRGILKGGRKGKPLRRSSACWKGTFACGAQGTESPRWQRPRALREISPENECWARSVGQPFKDGASAAPAC